MSCTRAPFFAIALDAAAGQSATVCADTELASVVVAGLRTPADGTEAKAAVTLARKCWDALNGGIVKQVAAGNSHYLKNACPTLLERKALTGLREARCREVISR